MQSASQSTGRAAALPVGVENGSRVAAKQRDLVGELATLVERDDGKGAAARRVPIDGEVFGVDLLRSRQSASLSLGLPFLFFFFFRLMLPASEQRGVGVGEVRESCFVVP